MMAVEARDFVGGGCIAVALTVIQLSACAKVEDAHETGVLEASTGGSGTAGMHSSTGAAVEGSGTSGADVGEVPVFDESRAIALVRADAWQPLEVQADPFPDRPTNATCDRRGWYEEFSTLEIDTEICPYAHLWQPSPVELPAGWAIRVRYSHKVLVADAPTFGHLGVTVAGATIVDAWVEIPSPAKVASVTIPLPVGMRVPAGAPIVLHVHNHGYNTWRLLEVSGLPPVSDA